ncbi:MAG TPA: Smr/MutS family protein, partial [Kofleriaceae bacterium]
ADRAAQKAYRERAKVKFEKETRVAHSEALASLKSARREIEDIRRELRARQAAEVSLEDLKAATRRLATPGAQVAKHEPRRATPPGTPATADKIVAGAPVIVPRLGRAEVVAMLADGKVEVRVGSMRAVVPLAEVLIDTHRAARRAERQQPPIAEPRRDTLLGHAGAPGSVELVDGVPAGGRANARTVDTTVDVRGNRADEAVAQVDRFVDESLMAGRDTVFVIHGHGTGALRTAIRTHLAAHKAVEKFRPGEQNEGGDGVTVAFLKG